MSKIKGVKPAPKPKPKPEKPATLDEPGPGGDRPPKPPGKP